MSRRGRFGGVIGGVARNRALARLLLAYLVMIIAEFGQWLALIVYAYARGGASEAGLVVILQLIPSMLLAPVISAHLARVGGATAGVGVDDQREPLAELGDNHHQVGEQQAGERAVARNASDHPAEPPPSGHSRGSPYPRRPGGGWGCAQRGLRR